MDKAEKVHNEICQVRLNQQFCGKRQTRRDKNWYPKREKQHYPKRYHD